MTCPNCGGDVDKSGNHHANGRISACPAGTCRKGHPLTPENTTTDKRGSRRCRQCSIEVSKAWRRRGAVVISSKIDAQCDPRRVRAAMAAYPDEDPSDACLVKSGWM